MFLFDNVIVTCVRQFAVNVTTQNGWQDITSMHYQVSSSTVCEILPRSPTIPSQSDNTVTVSLLAHLVNVRLCTKIPATALSPEISRRVLSRARVVELFARQTIAARGRGPRFNVVRNPVTDEVFASPLEVRLRNSGSERSIRTFSSNS